MDTETSRAYYAFQADAEKAKHLMADLQEMYPDIHINSRIIKRAFMDRLITTSEKSLLNRMIPDTLEIH